MSIMQLTDANHTKINQLLPELSLPAAIGDLEVAGISIDSRKIQPGDLFVALTGEHVNGRDYIDAAIKAGAVVALIEPDVQNLEGAIVKSYAIPVIAVASLNEKLGVIANQIFAKPSSQIKVVGVTGTNGKSTCVSLIAQLYTSVLGKSATIGTLGAQVDNHTIDFGMTTPDAASCHKALAFMRQHNVDLVAMEVSSHGLDQHRVADIQFDTAVFTNLTHDHLDYHKDLIQYAAVKQKLFEWPNLKNAVINLDDPHAAQMLAAGKERAKVYTYSVLHFVADVFATEITYNASGVSFQLHSPWGEAEVTSPLLGVFNVSNLLAAITTLLASGADLNKLISACSALESVPGRMELVENKADVAVVVDYAHTPDALQQAINALRAHVSGQLWVLFGCGGDRDRSKRPVMAKVAEQFADRVVATSDNPRSEVPANILTDVCHGFLNDTHVAIEDREQAIQFAIEKAEPGDVILLAGKGHEEYQIIANEKRPFSDVKIARAALQKRMSNQLCEERS